MKNIRNIKKLAVFSSLFLLCNTSMAAKVQQGDNLASKQEVFIATSGFSSLDPHARSAPRELLDFCENLVSTDKEGNVIPAAATSWSTKDNITYVFNLRKDGKWYDGTPVTADDFVYTFRRGATYSKKSKGFYRMLYLKNFSKVETGELPPTALGVKALDKYKFQITLEKPINYILQILSSERATPVHKGSIDRYTMNTDAEDDEIAINAIRNNIKYFICNGAYKPVSLSETELVGVRNKNYHSDKDSIVNKFTLVKSVSIADDANKFLQGKLHLTYRVPTDRFWILEKDYPDEVVNSKKLLMNFLQPNLNKAPMNDPKVRKLISYAIDRNILAFAYLAQGQNPAYTFTPANTTGYNIPLPAYAKLTQKQRDAKAQQLLKEAGYGEKKHLKFDLTYVHSDRNLISYTAVTAIKRMLTQTLKYVDINIVPITSKEYAVKKKNGDYQLLRKGWNSDFNDAMAFLGLLITKGSGLYTTYSNKKFDKIVEEAASTLDNNRRKKLYEEAETILSEELPVIPLYRGGHSRMVSSKLANFPVDHPEERYYIKELYLRTNTNAE